MTNLRHVAPLRIIQNELNRKLCISYCILISICADSQILILQPWLYWILLVLKYAPFTQIHSGIAWRLVSLSWICINTILINCDVRYMHIYFVYEYKSGKVFSLYSYRALYSFLSFIPFFSSPFLFMLIVHIFFF